LSSIQKLDARFPGLYPRTPPTEDDESGSEKPPRGFMQQFGWIYSAKQVAEFEGIPVSEAWDLPTIRAINTLNYLKAKADHERQLLEDAKHKK
jgi:hypothetical protein